MPILILILAQLLFTTGDFIARANLHKTPFSPAIFITWWFLVYAMLRTFATIGQLYVLSSFPIAKAYGVFGAVGIILASLGGYFWLKETITLWEYAGISLSLLAFIVLAIKH